jgi:hypothetical protein
MILIDTHTPMIVINLRTTYKDYFNSLSKKDRYKTRSIFKKNKDLEFREIKYDKETFQKFCELWERQIVYGKLLKKVYYDIGCTEKWNKDGTLHCFGVFLNGEQIAYTYAENYKGTINSHTTMYDKEKYLNRELGKFTFIKKIEWAMGKADYFYLGGLGYKTLIREKGEMDNNFRNFLRYRDVIPEMRWKWMFVPKEIKKNPETAQNYKIIWESHNKDHKYIQKI